MELLKKYFGNELSEEQLANFKKLTPLYQEWNAKINVISRKDIENLEEKHLLHSLAIAKHLSIPSGTHVLDIGTGGGFPGIPLAIFYPKVQFHLVDSIGKKIKVVEAVVNALEIKNVSYAHQRAEKVKGKYDFIVSRAVAKTDKLLHWTHNKFKKKAVADSGFLFLKGGDLEEELSNIKTPYQLVDLHTYFEESFFETKKLLYIPYL